MRIAMVIGLIVLLIAGSVASVSATPGPWSTPTPLPSPAGTNQAVQELAPAIGTAYIGVAETTVQGYNSINAQTNAFTLVWSLVLILVIIGGIWLIINRVQAL